MGKLKKNTQHSGRSALIDKLQEENKTLRSINRHLERELKKIHQSKGFPKEHTNKLLEEEFEEKDKENMCPRCTRGKITRTSLGIRTIIGCSVGCGYGEIIKNEKEKKSEEVQS